ncbi:antirestriction protein ArdA [Luteibacter sp. 22Crub2.1]|uniref:antirestriction protein ArdA n=1 Tax=Luteibacter sp. 22Crub2.1 TaxID=1283288 RepID=UPI0009A74CF3|nr:antirestriction protein ArdA [Luteibacter sp. 22Crub2.1]SKB50971.1 Antirestriction protein [Luteibacter sp. 22Crub2.1]
MSETRIYIASLSDYNSGHIHGVWIDLDGDTDRADIHQAIQSMLLTSRNQPAEEWAAHDYDGIPAAFGEHPDLDDLLEFVQGVEDHGDAFRAWVEDRGVTNFIHEDFGDKYAGEANSEREWIEEHLEEMGVLNGVPENLRPYFDSEAFLRDMKLAGDVSMVEFDGTVYAFWS